MAYVGSTPAELFGTLNPNSVKTIDIQDDAVTADKIAAGAVAYADVTGTPTLSTVATTGAYSDVTGTPTLATVATTGAYSDVTGTPTLATVATTGAYSDVTGTPTLATVATSGSYTDLTNKPTISTTATNIAGGSAGTIPYQTAADTTAMLGVGTAGQVLQTNGAGAPTWVTPAGGAWVLLSTVIANNVSTADVDTNIDSTYDTYAIVINEVSAPSGNRLYAHLKIAGSYPTTDYWMGWVSNDGAQQHYGQARITLLPNTFASGSSTSGMMYIHSPSNTTARHISWAARETRLQYFTQQVTGYAGVGSTGSLTGIRFFSFNSNTYPTTTITGTFRLYGIAK
jgi:hypothetical protein